MELTYIGGKGKEPDDALSLVEGAVKDVQYFAPKNGCLFVAVSIPVGSLNDGADTLAPRTLTPGIKYPAFGSSRRWLVEKRFLGRCSTEIVAEVDIHFQALEDVFLPVCGLCPSSPSRGWRTPRPSTRSHRASEA